MSAQFFLCVGVPKAGTSWLYEALRRHPQAWLPPVKELHFFDLPHIANHEFYRQSRREMLEKIREKSSDDSLIDWHRRYAVSEEGESLEWYKSLFEPGEGHAAFGEITPGYAICPRETFQMIAEEFPGVRFIVLLRDPVDRILSNIRFRTDRGHGYLQQCFEDPESFLSVAMSELYLAPTRYDELLEKFWMGVPLELEQVRWWFFEDLFSGDGIVDVYSEICEFLGLDRQSPPDMNKRNASSPQRFAFDPRAVLKPHLAPVYELVERQSGRLPARWRE